MNKEMYFIRVIPTNMPKNNLHKQIDKEIGQLCHLLNSDVEVLVDNIKRLVSKLNELHPRCRAATVSHTRPLENDENAEILIHPCSQCRMETVRLKDAAKLLMSAANEEQ